MRKPSTVIKASTAAGNGNLRLSHFQLNDVMEEARACLADAKTQADAILSEARAQAARIEEQDGHQGHQQGYETGYQEGLAAGREAGHREAHEKAVREFDEQQGSLISACRDAIEKINRDRHDWKEAARHDLIELAMAVARRVAHHVGDAHREVVLANLEEAVRLAGVRSDVTIAVHPQDADAAKAFGKTLRQAQEGWQNIRVVQESEVSPGGCRITWGTGSIDSTLQTQLDRIADELKAVGFTPDSDETVNHEDRSDA